MWLLGLKHPGTETHTGVFSLSQLENYKQNVRNAKEGKLHFYK